MTPLFSSRYHHQLINNPYLRTRDSPPNALNSTKKRGFIDLTIDNEYDVTENLPRKKSRSSSQSTEVSNEGKPRHIDWLNTGRHSTGSVSLLLLY